jgi:hypothetical protein
MAGARRPADHSLVGRGHGRVVARHVRPAAPGRIRRASCGRGRPTSSGSQARVPRLRRGRRPASGKPRRILRLRHPALARRGAWRAGDRTALGGGCGCGSRVVRLGGGAAAPIPPDPVARTGRGAYRRPLGGVGAEHGPTRPGPGAGAARGELRRRASRRDALPARSHAAAAPPSAKGFYAALGTALPLGLLTPAAGWLYGVAGGLAFWAMAAIALAGTALAARLSKHAP